MDIEGLIVNKLGLGIGKYKIERNLFKCKKLNRYDYVDCKNISDVVYYDLIESKSKKVRENFNKNVCLLCKKYGLLIVLINEKFIGYEYIVDNIDDISEMILNIKLNNKEL